MTEAEKHAYEAKAILDGAELEGRDLTPEERGEFETLLAKARQAREAGGQKDVVANIEGLGRAIGGEDLSAGDHGTGWAGVAKAISSQRQAQGGAVHATPSPQRPWPPESRSSNWRG